MFNYKVTLPAQLVLVIASVFLLGNYCNENIIRFFYTFSLFFKEILSFCLPFIIFSFVVKGILSFKKNAPLILAILISAIFISNSIIALLTYGVATLFVPYITQDMSTSSFVIGQSIEPYYQLVLPFSIKSEHALLLAIVVGIFLSLVHLPKVESVITRLKNSVEIFLNNYFIPLLPLYVFGFLLEVQYKGIFENLFIHYGKTFGIIFVTQTLFILAYYLVAACGSASRGFKYIRNAWPSYVTAFSTMSSTATIPVSINCAEKNMGNRPLAQIAMPIMANIHLLGDSVGTPLLALVTASLFLGHVPDLISYITFVSYFCTAMLAVSGIPGGGIIVMIPVLVSQFGFNQEMVSIVTTLYLLLDPFGTAANVMGDGALIIIVKRILQKLRIL